MGEGERGSATDRPALLLEARAKINLGLEVLGVRRDGYHEIRTLMQSVRLSDRIEIVPARKGRLVVRAPGSGLPVGEGNLVYRAAALLRDLADPAAGARITLWKRIPVGAGLGGGSSDAAATLAGLNRIWRLGLKVSELEDLGARLGADVPFFLRGGTQLAEGIGERLTRLPSMPPCPVLILYPGFPVSTASVYGDPALKLTPGGPLSRLSNCDLASRPGIYRFAGGLLNALEPVVLSRHARIRRLMGGVRSMAPAIVRVSGSGSSLFVLGGGVSTLSRILGKVPVRDCRVYETRFASRGWISIGPRGMRS